jgi:hypothetical protein
MADEQGIREVAVSLTHEGAMAAAVVVALCAEGDTHADADADADAGHEER